METRDGHTYKVLYSVEHLQLVCGTQYCGITLTVCHISVCALNNGALALHFQPAGPCDTDQ